MDRAPLRIEDQPDSRDIQFLEDRIYEYNVAATGLTDGRLLSLFVRDEQGAIAAGLYGWTWGECLEVRYLWVREELRGQGHGTRLLAAAEREAVRRGCRRALIETHSFQASDLYQRLGYRIYATVEDYPRGHKKYSLAKPLRRSWLRSAAPGKAAYLRSLVPEAIVNLLRRIFRAGVPRR